MNKGINWMYIHPSIFIGMAQFFHRERHYNHLNYSLFSEEADFRALRSDWQNVGNELRLAMDLFAKENIGLLDER